MKITEGMITRARKIAEKAHLGQVDKCGVSYISHVTNVATRAEAIVAYKNSLEQQESTVTVAWLHDVVEDTEVTQEDIVLQFPREVFDAVEAITHRINEPYWDYIRRVKANDIAADVKIADLLDNMRPDRAIRVKDSTDHKRLIYTLIPRYYVAYGILIDKEKC